MRPNGKTPNIDIIYPSLRRFVFDEFGNSITLFANKLGYIDGSVRNWLMGKYDPGKKMIDDVLTLTGMTYEEAFKIGAQKEEKRF